MNEEISKSEFEKQFPKPAECESPALILRWENRRESWLAALKWELERINFHYGDAFENSLINKDIEKEIEANEKTIS